MHKMPDVFADLDRDCDDPCIAAAWALQQRYYDPNTSPFDRVDVYVLIVWLYSNPLTIEEVYNHSRWSAEIMLDCLRTYPAPVNNSFLLINTDIAKRALEACLEEENSDEDN